MTLNLKTYWREILIAFLIVLLIFSFRDCSPETSTVTTYKDVKVKVPEIVGELKPSNITEIPSKGTDSIIYKNRIIYSTHPFDKNLAKKYLKSTDSLKDLLYIRSIQEKENISDFSDQYIDLKIRTKVQGELKDIKADYKIKEREITLQEKTITNTITVKEPRDRFSWVVGVGYNHSLDLRNNSSFEANAGIRLGKVIILGSATTEKQLGGKILIQL